MNINLISPQQNGHNFNVRFKEDIIIPENSKVYLNFAELRRDESTLFIDDQDIEIDLLDTRTILFPKNLTGGADGDTFTLSKSKTGGVFNRRNFTIKKGSLTNETLLNSISVGLDNILLGLLEDGSGADTNLGKLSHYRAIKNEDLAKIQDEDGNSVVGVGFLRDLSSAAQKQNRVGRDFTFDGTHKRNAGQVIDFDNYELMMMYKRDIVDTNANILTKALGFDNYAISDRPFNHCNYDDNTPLRQQNKIEVMTSMSPDELADRGRDAIALNVNNRDGVVEFGIINKMVLDGLNVGGAGEGAYPADDPFRTNGGNATNSAGNPNPAMLPKVGGGRGPNPENRCMASIISIQVDCSKPDTSGLVLRIKMPRFDLGGGAGNSLPINDMRSAQDHIVSMKHINRRGIPIDHFDNHTDTELHLGLLLYTEDNTHDDTTDAKTYFIVYQPTKANYNFNIKHKENSLSVIYDSKSDNLFIPYSYFFKNLDGGVGIDYTTGTSADKIKKLRTQAYPFSVYCSSSVAQEGFTLVGYDQINDTDLTKPPIRVERYALRASSALANVLNLPPIIDTNVAHIAPIHQIYFPDTRDIQSMFLNFSRDFNFDWKGTSYSIFINGLPLKNFKNTETTDTNGSSRGKNGGYSKSILANIPAPFRDSILIDETHKQELTAVYEPNYQIMNNLYNQTMITNNFDIEIKNSANDKEASEITRSIINFTILPPDSYKGNLNSVASLKI